MFDPVEKRLRRSWAFVLTLSHSRHQFAKFTFDQKVETWLELHIEAFEYFGGVPKEMVLDNLKAAIVKAALYMTLMSTGYTWSWQSIMDFSYLPAGSELPGIKGR